MRICRAYLRKKIAYSLQAERRLWAEDPQFEPDGIRFTICTAEHRFARTSLVGRFNVLTAWQRRLHAAGVRPVGRSRSERYRGDGRYPGRMERIDMGQAFTVTTISRIT